SSASRPRSRSRTRRAFARSRSIVSSAMAISEPQQAAERPAEFRLTEVLGGGVAPDAIVLHGDVLDRGGAALTVVARELGGATPHRIESVEQVDPSARYLARREPVGAGPLGGELVLDLV